VGGQLFIGCDDPLLINSWHLVQSINNLSLENALPKARSPVSDREAFKASFTSFKCRRIILDVKCIAVDGLYSQSLASTLMNRSSVSEGVTPVHREAAPPPNEDATDATSLPWYRRTLEFLTVYNELCTEDFAPVRTKLQQEWTFDGGFVRRFTIVFLDSLLMHY